MSAAQEAPSASIQASIAVSSLRVANGLQLGFGLVARSLAMRSWFSRMVSLAIRRGAVVMVVVFA